jgi:TPR repeat protein
MRIAISAAFLAGALAAPGFAQERSLAESCAAGAPRGDFRICAAAVASAPHDTAVRRLYAQSLAKAADYDGAVRQYGEITRLAPADGRAFYEYAWMLAFVRRYAEAVEPIERSMKLQPAHVESIRAAAIIYQLTKRDGDALRVALAGARLGDSISMFDLFDLYAEGRGTAKDETQAFVWLVKAAETGHVMAMDRLADIFLNGGLGRAPDADKAVEWATKARLARSGKL